MVRYLGVCAILFLACTHKSPEEELINTIDPAISWVATLQFAGEKWLVNSVPTSFVRSSIGQAEKDFDRAIGSIDQSPVRKELREAVRRQLDGSRDAAERLKGAIEKGDHRTVAELVKRFADASSMLQHLRNEEEK